MFSNKKKNIPYVVKTTITQHLSPMETTNMWKVIVEGSGFTGEADEYTLSSAFENAYQNLMTKVAESIFQEEKS